jgi:hypothetical protein
MEAKLIDEQKPENAPKDINVDGDVASSVFIQGNSNTVQIFNSETLYNLKYLAPLLEEMLTSQHELSTFFRDAMDSLQGNNIEKLLKSYNLLYVLAEFKKQDPIKYEQFIADGISSALGLPVGLVRQTDSFAGPIEPSVVKSALQDVDEDLDFQDRTTIVSDIFTHNHKYFVLYGPSGIGKSHLLAHLKPYTYFKPTRSNVRCVDIDLLKCSSSIDVLHQVIRGLGGNENGGINEFARLIAVLQHGDPSISQILFLFDWDPTDNSEIIDWLLSPKGLIEDPGLNDRLEAFGVRGLISLKVVIAAHHPVKSKIPDYTPEKIPVGPLPVDSILAMLQDLAARRGFPVTPLMTKKIGQKIHYLTGGHPKCAKLMSVAIANQAFAEPNPELWNEYFKRYSLGIIHKDIVSSISQLQLVETLWRLSVFRRFDQRLLASLLGRKVIPEISTGKDTSRQARELRIALESTDLVSDLDSGTQTLSVNFSLRRALALGLEYNSPELYRAINSEALKIFAERLHDENSIPRAIMFLIEFIYHMVKTLETTPDIQPNAINKHMHQALQEYLPIALAVIKQDEQDDFLRLLQSAWEADEELAVLIRYCAGENCLTALTNQIKKFSEEHN